MAPTHVGTGLQERDLIVDIGDLRSDGARRTVESGEQCVAVLQNREEPIALRSELSFKTLADVASARIDVCSMTIAWLDTASFSIRFSTCCDTWFAAFNSSIAWLNDPALRTAASIWLLPVVSYVARVIAASCALSWAAVASLLFNALLNDRRVAFSLASWLRSFNTFVCWALNAASAELTDPPAALRFGCIAASSAMSCARRCCSAAIAEFGACDLLVELLA